MTMPSLLPPNATPIETAYVTSGGRILDADPPVDMVWDAWRCPSKYLPYLAWALSVDQWSDDWDEIAQRQAIADSPAWHRIKGTRAAVEQAIVRATDAPATLTEWWETAPRGRRGTSSLHLSIDDFSIAATTARRIQPMVMAAKPKSRPIIITAGPVIAGPLTLAGLIYAGSLTVIQPQGYQGEDAMGVIAIGGLVSLRSEITVRPS